MMKRSARNNKLFATLKEHYKGMISDDADAKHGRYQIRADEENLKQDDDSEQRLSWFRGAS